MAVEIRAEIDVKGLVPGVTLKQKEWNDLVRDMYRHGARFVRAHVIPRHFDEDDAKNYPAHKPRSKKYEKHKENVMGHKRPLVYSGESFQRATDARIIAKAKKGQGWAAVRINAPALNYSKPGWKVNMREEVQSVLPSDVQDIMGGMLLFLRDRVRNYQAGVSVGAA